MEDLIPGFSESVEDMNFAYNAIMKHPYSKVSSLLPPEFNQNKETCLAFEKYVNSN